MGSPARTLLVIFIGYWIFKYGPGFLSGLLISHQFICWFDFDINEINNQYQALKFKLASQ